MRRGAILVVLATTLGTTTLLCAPVARADVASCIASSEQALTLRKQGKLHDALQQLAQCADPSCPAEVSGECTQRIATLNAAMPTLILAAKDGSGNDLYDVKVTMDGAPLAAKLDGHPLSIDPGEHAFHFEVAGQPAVDKQLVLREGEKDRHETVVLGPPPPPAPVAPPPVAPAAPAAPPPSGPSWWTTQRTLAVIGGGVGVVGLGIGAIFGGLAMSDQSQEKSNCSSGGCSNRPQAVADYNTGSSNATASTVGFIAGGVLLAAGAVLFFTAPSPAAAPSTGHLWLAPSPTSGGAGFVLGGEL
jgi:hypothetical protein